MNPFKNVLYTTDFSQYSDYALDYAKAFASMQPDGRIDCLHVIDDGGSAEYVILGGMYEANTYHEEMLNSARESASKQLAHIETKQDHLGVNVHTHLKQGHIAEQVVAAAEELGDDLIVIATHGRSGLSGMIFGSTCEKVVRSSGIPVLTIKHPEHDFVTDKGDTVELARVMCPVDFSNLSLSVLPRCEQICRDFNATLVLTHVVDPRWEFPEVNAQAVFNNTDHLMKKSTEYLNDLADKIEGVNVEVCIKEGSPAKVLAHLSDEENIDLVVMPTHGRGGIKHMLLGSTAERVVRLAHCPVLTIKPQEE